MKTTTPCDGTCASTDFHTAHLTRRYRLWLKVRYRNGAAK